MWLAIVILLVVGVLLILTELIFIPGTTIFGIAGLVLAATGVIMAFVNFGNGTGFSVLGVTFACILVLLFISIRSNTWEKISLKSAINSRVNDDVKNNLWKGDKGIAHSALRPGGKAEFKDIIVEVSTLGQYLEAGTEVRILSIQDNRIIVEPANAEHTKNT
ncbi:NfeD family protein [Catalinimonas niigatensis]|uniref:NfeD family protein n=1 Tax=Catalinimonas niigatensis TaxID=1397264 RepID=UPI002666CB0B|nr:NfeD family protein [Catalinimonas niigatensis]WPP49016.1 NfeD family protein [Catalinimonas niigatensis]